MSDESNRAEHYRDVAMEYRRLATTSSSIQMRERYLRMAAHYGKLAEDEVDEQAREKDEYSSTGPAEPDCVSRTPRNTTVEGPRGRRHHAAPRVRLWGQFS